MEARPTQKQVIASSLFWESYDNVYVQGLDLFGFYQAELYANKIKSILYELDQTSRMPTPSHEKPHVPEHHLGFTPYHLPHHRGTDRGIGHRPFCIQHAKDQENKEYPHRITQRKASHP